MSSFFGEDWGTLGFEENALARLFSWERLVFGSSSADTDEGSFSVSDTFTSSCEDLV